ncbi:MAG: 3-hydroxyacyl-CoA dehydrogenase [Desulfatiglans sp.]|nr:3-hydroxyacyl-CoA dehydrogenase [Thermodesulfobacteriota bacterium]MEE4353084.1 3-hydroxyacyl-CoA dehydrogenase [Desulfatiglans sp.]
MNIKDTVAVITGGASGLGEACVRNLVGLGGKVSILDFAEERGNQVAEELGDSVIFCNTDVTDEKSVQAAVDKTMDAFGAIHIAVNCAGVGTPAKVLGKDGPMSIDLFNRVVQINLIGTFNVIRLSADKMVKNEPTEDGERGVVINTASVAAFEGQIGQPAYSASKAGVVGMTLPIAREFAEYGIRVLTIAPGIFETPMLAGLPDNVKESLGKMVPFPPRLGRPSEFAGTVQHIIENTILNAEVIRLDGGIRMAAK